MNIAFALGAVVAVVATVLMITRQDAVHALLYFVVSLLASAVVMFVLGAAFVAALEVIVYAGAIMVLFVFVIMLMGPARIPVSGRAWIGPSILSAVLLVEVAWALAQGRFTAQPAAEVTPKQVGMSLFGPYILGSEIAAFLLLAGLVGAFHLGRRASNGSGDAHVSAGAGAQGRDR
ncbi:MAG TPA: NADH-quinone oxidoreductase subunit J [Spirochaetia bacterium]|nr:NADH-quinone oxidoreductase subunit J [Spirochaetia bacterium]